MSQAQYSELYELGIKPPQVQYLILYYSQLVPGIQACFTWSAEPRDRVLDLFRSDFHEHRPEVRMLMPTSEN
jgi:hypothetical protein